MVRAVVALTALALSVPGVAEARPAGASKCLAGKAGKTAQPAKRRCLRLPSHTAAAVPGVRMSRDPQAALPSPAPSVPAPGLPPVTPPAAPATPVAPARLGVVAREFSLLLSRSTLPAGVAVVELTNRGEDAHNLRVERVGFAPLDVPLAESGEVTRATGALAPGEWRVLCALPGHEEAGMHARLTVTP